MRQIIKPKNSKAKSLVYQENRDNSKLRDILLEEQNKICAYTETYFDRSSKAEIEHFNPTLKRTDKDGYENYFAVKGQWNSEKGKTARWLKFHPVMHPTDKSLEEKVQYKGGVFYAEEGDIHADNLIKYLKLNDYELTIERVEYIQHHRNKIRESGYKPIEHFQFLLKEFPKAVYFIRAIQEEFGIKLSLSNNK